MILFRLILLIPALLFFPFTFCQGEDGTAPASSIQNPANAATFGSRIIQSSLWTPEELMGKPEDKIAVRLTASFNGNLPQRKIPVNIQAPLSPELQNSIRRVAPINGIKVIALTFDLCESATEKSGYDAEIVNYLRENSVKATFFAGGKWMLSHPDKTMQLMTDPLFEVGNHSWSHANFRTIDSGRMDAQILWTQAQYELFRETLRERVIAKQIDPSEMNKIPKTPLVFRFPYGACSPIALDKLKYFGLPAIQWDIVTGDPARGRSPTEIAQVILQKIRPGAIIICHANGRGYGTAASLPLFVTKLRARGYDFVTVSELLTHGPAVSHKECYELMPGDNRRYDRTAGMKQSDHR
ncbi:MAG: polysaccharide deacetylase family protein [Deltaproteobacteria bacterium]|nr:polysaccharide deacetylase family protein [Deltaproteobacteria bacterium]